MLIVSFVIIAMTGWGQKAIIVTFTPQNRQCLKSQLEQRGIEVTVDGEMPDSTTLSQYDAMFLLLGSFEIIDWPLGQFIVNKYLAAGKNLYVEGDVDAWDDVYNTIFLDALGIAPDIGGSVLTYFVYGHGRYDDINLHYPETYPARWFNLSQPEVDTTLVAEDGSPIAIEYEGENYRTFAYGGRTSFYPDCDDPELIEFFDELTDYIFTVADTPESVSVPHKVISVEYFDLLGRQISKPVKGFYIERKHTDKGIISTKHYVQ